MQDKKIESDQARQNFVKTAGDHFTLLNVFNEWADTGFSISWTYENFVQVKALSRVRDIRDQLSALCERVEISPESNADSNDYVPIQKALLSGYFNNAARLSRSGDSYKVMKSGGSSTSCFIHPSSCLFMRQPPSKCILYYELVLTSKEYLRQVMEIKPEWLLEGALGLACPRRD
jgi:pre-mRNA-splicing factor ATP-dependent RNA helicase DHX16